jgi:S1-C subfamily serine protease
MSPDDEDGDEARQDPDVAGGPPPQPADRTWVHPSELQSFVATPVATGGGGGSRVRPREWAVGFGSAVAASVVTVLVLVAFGALGNGSRSDVPSPNFVGTPSGVDYSIARRIAAETAPSVVTVRVVGGDGTAQPVGSGVVLASDRVVTNAHLVQGASALEILTYDGQRLPAKVVGTDPETDLTLLSVTGADLRTVSQGDADGTAVGGTVVAVAANRSGGYRTDIDVISDQNRFVDTGTGAMVAGALETGIQPGAAWAGGALVDSSGNLVGILTSTSTAGVGLVAVPVTAVRDVRDQLEATGTVSHGWLGVVFGDDAVDRPRGGARVRLVIPGSPAAKGGLAAGDVMTDVADQAVHGYADAIAAVRALRPQDPVEVGYVDPSGHTHRARVTLAATDPAVQASYPVNG